MIDLYEVAGRLGMTGKGWAWLGFPKTTLQTQQAFVGHESALANMDGFLAIRPQGNFPRIFIKLFKKNQKIL